MCNEVIGRFSTAGGTHYTLFTVKSNGKLALFYTVAGGGGRSLDGTGSHTLSTATWYHVAMTYASATTTLNGYVNGSLDNTDSTGATNSLDTNAAPTYIGNDNQGAGFFWNGAIDEPRIASVPRSADWISVEYANQKPSANLVALGPET